MVVSPQGGGCTYDVQLTRADGMGIPPKGRKHPVILSIAKDLAFPLALFRPSPLVGEGQGEGGGSHSCTQSNLLNHTHLSPPPQPSPIKGEEVCVVSPQGGGGMVVSPIH